MLRPIVVALMLAALSGCTGSPAAEDAPEDRAPESATQPVAEAPPPASTSTSRAATPMAAGAPAAPEPVVVYDLDLRIKGSGVLSQSFDAPAGDFSIRFGIWRSDVPCVGAAVFRLTDPMGQVETESWDCEVLITGPTVFVNPIDRDGSRGGGVYTLEVAFTGTMRTVFQVTVTPDEPYQVAESEHLTHFRAWFVGDAVLEQDFVAPEAGAYAGGIIMPGRDMPCAAAGDFMVLYGKQIVQQHIMECEVTGMGAVWVPTIGSNGPGLHTIRFTMAGVGDVLWYAKMPDPDAP